jgi:hypothetical protein
MAMSNINPVDGRRKTSKNTTVEDPRQPDWKKQKSLQEIDLIRQAKKEQLINSVMGSYTTNSKIISLIPG